MKKKGKEKEEWKPVFEKKKKRKKRKERKPVFDALGNWIHIKMGAYLFILQ
jgi:hypothetical protein